MSDKKINHYQNIFKFCNKIFLKNLQKNLEKQF